MKRTLKEIADIQAGYSFRIRLEPSPCGVLVVQMRDLSDDDAVNRHSLQRIDTNEVKSAHLLRRQDLIFRSRGFDMRPALLDFEPPEPMLLAAPLYRLRVGSEVDALPEYLNWYLHQHEAQAYIRSRVKGTAQKMVSKNSLGGLPVDLPDLKTQQAIVELASLLKREAILLKTLSAKRQAMISTQLMHLAKG